MLLTLTELQTIPCFSHSSIKDFEVGLGVSVPDKIKISTFPFFFASLRKELKSNAIEAFSMNFKNI
jgi:hypothetical protein